MNDSKSLARYKAAVRRYSANSLTKPKAQAEKAKVKPGYETVKYLGFDPVTGTKQVETSSGIKSVRSLSNNAIPKDGTGLYAQGFLIHPYTR